MASPPVHRRCSQVSSTVGKPVSQVSRTVSRSGSNLSIDLSHLWTELAYRKMCVSFHRFYDTGERCTLVAPNRVGALRLMAVESAPPVSSIFERCETKTALPCFVDQIAYAIKVSGSSSLSDTIVSSLLMLISSAMVCCRLVRSDR